MSRTKMTDEEMRIAIAEACGWKWESNGSGGQLLRRPDGTIENGHYTESWRVPDYLNDLNAMAKAVETLGIDGEDYAHSLWMLVAANRPYNVRKAMLVLAEATARQRAEAFLRTIGKWKD